MDKKTKKIYPYLLYMVLPFVSLVLAFSNIRKSWSKNIVWLFAPFLGLTVIMPKETDNHDLNRYKDFFVRAVDSRHESFFTVFMESYSHGKHSDADIYANVLTISVSRFTSSFDVFLVVVGLVFGYFYSRNCYFAIDQVKKKLSLPALIFFVFGLLIIPIWAINGYRFATAAMVFVYGLFRYYKGDKGWGRFWILMSPLIHFSMWLCVAVYLLNLLIGNRFKLLFFILLISLVGGNVNPELVFKNAEVLPLVFQAKVKGYSSEKYRSAVIKNASADVWYVKGHLVSARLLIYLSIFLLFIKRKSVLNKLEPKVYSLLCFGVLLLSVTNIMSVLPSSARFYSIAIHVLCAAFILIFQTTKMKKYSQKLQFAMLLPFLVFFVVRIRIGLEEIGFNTILLNPLTAWFFPDSANFLDIIK